MTSGSEEGNRLFTRWLEAQGRGEDLSVSDLCAENPELKSELSERIASWTKDASEAQADTVEPGDTNTASASNEWAGAFSLTDTVVLTKEEFRRRLEKSGVLTDGLRTSCEEILSRHSSVPPAAAEILESDLLTLFQLEQLTDHPDACLRLGDYVLEDQIGRGGMGEVFRARHVHMKRTVALKRIDSRQFEEDHVRKRFHREIEATGRLEHPRIITAYDAGSTNGFYYLVMKYVEGRDLQDVVTTEGPLDVSEAVRLVSEIAEGLSCIHAAGMVHRDIKPRNLMLGTDGHIQILDLGLANPFFNSDGDPYADAAKITMTTPGAFLGTAAYCSPEQAEDAHGADARSDLYSLGCTLYFLLSGQSPYPGETLTGSIIAHQDLPVPDIRSTRGDCPAWIGRLIERLMAKNPDDRIQTADELIQVVDQHQSAASDSHSVGFFRRRSLYLATATVVALVVAALAVHSNWSLESDGTGRDAGDEKVPVASTGIDDFDEETQPPSLLPQDADELVLAERVIHLGGTFEYIAGDNNTGTVQDDAGLIELRRAPLWFITRVDLPRVQTLTVDDFRLLSQRTKLRTLNCPNSNASDDMVAMLENSASLRSLFLEGSDVTDTGLAYVSRIPSLRHIELSSTQITDAGVENLPLDQMYGLGLNRCSIGVDTWNRLAQARHLTVFECLGLHLTDEQLGIVAGMPDLNWLNISDCALDSADLARITASCRNIATLHMRQNPLTDDVIPDLLTLPKLGTLDVSYTAISPEGLDRLREGLPNCRITAEQMELGWHWLPQDKFQRQVAERVLDLGGYLHLITLDGRVTVSADTESPDLEENCPYLVSGIFLQRTGTQLLTQDDFRNFAQLQALTHLLLRGTNVSDDFISELAGHSVLTAVDIGFTQVSDSGLEVIASLPELTSIDLGYSQVSEAGLLKLPLARLRNLSIQGMELSDQFWLKLRNAAELSRLVAGGVELNQLAAETVGQLPLTVSYLNGCGIDDSELESLSNLSGILRLHLQGNAVTDKSVPSLSRLTTLEYLRISGTGISMSGVKILRAALPGCKIEADAAQMAE